MNIHQHVSVGCPAQSQLAAQVKVITVVDDVSGPVRIHCSAVSQRGSFDYISPSSRDMSRIAALNSSIGTWRH